MRYQIKVMDPHRIHANVFMQDRFVLILVVSHKSKYRDEEVKYRFKNYYYFSKHIENIHMLSRMYKGVLFSFYWLSLHPLCRSFINTEQIT